MSIGTSLPSPPGEGAGVRLIIPLLLISLFTSCGIERNLKKGEQHLALGEYYDAAAQFKQVYSKTPPKERENRGKRALKMAWQNQLHAQGRRRLPQRHTLWAGFARRPVGLRAVTAEKRRL